MELVQLSNQLSYDDDYYLHGALIIDVDCCHGRLRKGKQRNMITISVLKVPYGTGK